MTQSYPGTQSVVRAIRLLKLFGGERSEWTLNELVESVNLNKTTVFRMLTALESEGLIERTESNTYRFGPEMVALGGQAMRHNTLHQVASPLLEALVERTGERTTLEQLIINPDQSYAMLVLVEIQGKHLISINQFIGSRLPMHATSTGKALLAFLPDEERELVLQQKFDPLTSKTLVDTASLRRQLETFRQQGYATAISELETGLMAAGTPIWDHSGKPIAAISIEGPESRIDVERLNQLGGELIETAKEISFRLGYRGA
ncbi:MAG: IclR family transcriptional regulator [Chloroflexota bacterium]